MDTTLLQKINDFWIDPTIGLASLNEFHRKLKENDVVVTKKELKNWYDGLAVNQVTKTVKRSDNDFITISCPDDKQCIQADLMDISKYTKQNKNYKFLLNVIHLQTRYAWCFPIKNKTASDIANLLKKVFTECLKRSKNEIILTTDEGTEFNSVKDVEHVKSTNKNNTAVVERFNRTLWNYINKYCSYKKTLLFVDVLPSLIIKYNNSYHRTIKTKPILLWKNNEKYNKPNEVKETFSIGDHVRHLVKANTFEKKSFKNKYSENVYKIESKKGYRYLLSNNNYYLARELLLVDDFVAQEEKETLEKQKEKVTKLNKTVRNNKKDFKGDEVESVGTTVQYKPRMKPKSKKRIQKVREVLDL